MYYKKKLFNNFTLNSIAQYKAHKTAGLKSSFKYVTYDNYGHVPYPSFYDGLKYILGDNYEKLLLTIYNCN